MLSSSQEGEDIMGSHQFPGLKLTQGKNSHCVSNITIINEKMLHSSPKENSVSKLLQIRISHLCALLSLWPTEKIRELSSKMQSCTLVHMYIYFFQQNYVKFQRGYSVQVASPLCSQMRTNYPNDTSVKTVASSSRDYRKGSPL